jgi:Protein of unknown function (DUF2795)
MARAFPRSLGGNHGCVDPADAAALKTTLVGVPLPAEKPQLLEYAVQQRTEPRLLEGLRTLPEEKTYESLDDVVEELLHVQPPRLDPDPHEPEEEAGAPPGGDAYTDKDPETGKVRR